MKRNIYRYSKILRYVFMINQDRLLYKYRQRKYSIVFENLSVQFGVLKNFPNLITLS